MRAKRTLTFRSAEKNMHGRLEMILCHKSASRVDLVPRFTLSLSAGYAACQLGSALSAEHWHTFGQIQGDYDGPF